MPCGQFGAFARARLHGGECVGEGTFVFCTGRAMFSIATAGASRSSWSLTRRASPCPLRSQVSACLIS
eukprot:8987098-Lingulodinium_polyedra.AAC.1